VAAKQIAWGAIAGLLSWDLASLSKTGRYVSSKIMPRPAIPMRKTAESRCKAAMMIPVGKWGFMQHKRHYRTLETIAVKVTADLDQIPTSDNHHYVA
jgi:hypothetical protein